LTGLLVVVGYLLERPSFHNCPLFCAH
jgi:hypothetical protein